MSAPPSSSSASIVDSAGPTRRSIRSATSARFQYGAPMSAQRAVMSQVSRRPSGGSDLAMQSALYPV